MNGKKIPLPYEWCSSNKYELDSYEEHRSRCIFFTIEGNTIIRPLPMTQYPLETQQFFSKWANSDSNLLLYSVCKDRYDRREFLLLRFIILEKGKDYIFDTSSRRIRCGTEPQMCVYPHGGGAPAACMVVDAHSGRLIDEWEEHRLNLQIDSRFQGSFLCGTYFDTCPEKRPENLDDFSMDCPGKVILRDDLGIFSGSPVKPDRVTVCYLSDYGSRLAKPAMVQLERSQVSSNSYELPVAAVEDYIPEKIKITGYPSSGDGVTVSVYYKRQNWNRRY